MFVRDDAKGFFLNSNNLLDTGIIGTASYDKATA
jgi:hypothetical protein